MNVTTKHWQTIKIAAGERETWNDRQFLGFYEDDAGILGSWGCIKVVILSFLEFFLEIVIWNFKFFSELVRVRILLGTIIFGFFFTGFMHFSLILSPICRKYVWFKTHPYKNLCIPPLSGFSYLKLEWSKIFQKNVGNSLNLTKLR